MTRRLISVFTLFVAMVACVDPITFNIPPAADILVVEGSINDEPGPYRVKLSRGSNLDDPTLAAPVSGASITLFEDDAVTETLTEVASGEYITNGIIQGRVGHTYHIVITLHDGSVFQSDPERIIETGEVTALWYEFEPRTSFKSFGQVDANVFNVYVNAEAPAEDDDTFVRWRYTGTYRIETYPELHQTLSQGFWYKTPFHCSGYVVMPALGGGRLEQVAPCTCCTCWVRQYESMPQLSDTELIANGKFSGLKVAEVPINSATFFDKFKIEVEQMSLSRVAFEYFSIIRSQKEGASNLFQPSPGRLTGNIHAVGSDKPAIGLFWATSVRRESVYIPRSAVPYNVPEPPLVTLPCNSFYPNATAIKPTDWND